MNAQPLLSVKGLNKAFLIKRKPKPILKDISFSLGAGEILGIIGESGSGKSTLIRCIHGLISTDSGEVLWKQKKMEGYPQVVDEIQMIFQDPLESINPRYNVKEILCEGVIAREGKEKAAQISESELTRLLEAVELEGSFLYRFPQEMSGGQRQRVSIARALLLKPKLLICDEPVSALDLSTQKQIIQLLTTLRKEWGLSILFVSHHLDQVAAFCDRVLVLLEGMVVEIGTAKEILSHPRHPYTKWLIDSKPKPKWETGE